jgi:hypothetical protein
MKFIFLLLALPLSNALATPVPPSEVVYSNPRIPGSTGYDKQILQLHAEQEDFDNGTFFIRVDMRQGKVTNFRLPRATFTNYCGQYRSSGGSIGDYKPKSIYRTLKVLVEPRNIEWSVYHFGRSGQDYNETPVVHTFAEFHPRGTQINIPADSDLMAMILRKCRNQRPYPFVQMIWQTSHLCRWKPEIWHKPNLWEDEYRFPFAARITKNVVLHCVNR